MCAAIMASSCMRARAHTPTRQTGAYTTVYARERFSRGAAASVCCAHAARGGPPSEFRSSLFLSLPLSSACARARAPSRVRLNVAACVRACACVRALRAPFVPRAGTDIHTRRPVCACASRGLFHRIIARCLSRDLCRASSRRDRRCPADPLYLAVIPRARIGPGREKQKVRSALFTHALN